MTITLLAALAACGAALLLRLRCATARPKDAGLLQRGTGRPGSAAQLPARPAAHTATFLPPPLRLPPLLRVMPDRKAGGNSRLPVWRRVSTETFPITPYTN